MTPTVYPSPDAGEELQAAIEARVSDATFDELALRTDCPHGCDATYADGACEHGFLSAGVTEGIL